jgi:hypothetical protein
MLSEIQQTIHTPALLKATASHLCFPLFFTAMRDWIYLVRNKEEAKKIEIDQNYDQRQRMISDMSKSPG